MSLFRKADKILRTAGRAFSTTSSDSSASLSTPFDNLLNACEEVLAGNKKRPSESLDLTAPESIERREQQELSVSMLRKRSIQHQPNDVRPKRMSVELDVTEYDFTGIS